MRELTKREIEEKEEYIKTLRGKEEYKFYFSDESLNMPVRAWMDGGYYIDLTEYAGTFFLGAIKLQEEANSFGVVALIRQLVEEYGELCLWCYKENKQSMRFHDTFERSKKWNVKRFVDKKISLIMIERWENEKLGKFKKRI